MNFSINTKWLFWLTSSSIFIIAPDLGIGLIHTVFEVFEILLDEIVEHLLHTDRHTTQIIVFYLMWLMAIYPAYRFYRYCYQCALALKENIPNWCYAKKQQAKNHWHQQPLISKCKWITRCFLGVVGISYLVF